jgi:hypothetical protein
LSESLICRYDYPREGLGQHVGTLIEEREQNGFTRGNRLINQSKKILGLLILFLFISGISSSTLYSFSRKLKVIVDKASVHLDPDKKSSLVALLDKGTLLTLGSERKFRKNWNYVYFTSEKSGRTKSGYVLDSSVEKLFEVTKKSTIQREGGEVRAEKTNFRDTRWGMNKAQVVRIEGSTDHHENSGGLDIIQYPHKILDMDCMIGYVFAYNKLAKAKYSFLAKYKDKNQYIHSYEKIRDALIHKYEKPKTDKVLWNDKQYKDDRSNWGLALSLGQLEFSSLWKDSETEIQLRAYGGRNRVFLVVLYSGIEYMDLAQKVRSQSQLSIW